MFVGDAEEDEDNWTSDDDAPIKTSKTHPDLFGKFAKAYAIVTGDHLIN